MSRHRLDPVRPRYGRLAAALASLAVTFVALLGGVGVLPVEHADVSAADASLASATENDDGTRGPDGPSRNHGSPDGTTDGPTNEPAAEVSGGPTRPASTPSSSATSTADQPVVATVVPKRHRSYPVPGDSGSGRRVVFDQSQQRVWLVSGSGRVLRTYLVSGSVTDNLQPGSYQVYSRSARAVGVDGSGTMRWFVRFTAGESAAIGFHDIPVNAGLPIQNVSQLGTPQSHGCIRQREADAKAMWEFAPLETWVYVVA
jgi:lipoprotein-anchoring transpeptidase ErfK/SrfK